MSQWLKIAQKSLILEHPINETFLVIFEHSASNSLTSRVSISLLIIKGSGISSH